MLHIDTIEVTPFRFRNSLKFIPVVLSKERNPIPKHIPSDESDLNIVLHLFYILVNPFMYFLASQTIEYTHTKEKL